MIDDKTRAVLKDVERPSRWGHYYQEAVEAGLIRVDPPEVFMNGIYRDTRRPVARTEAGNKALGYV
jgi:hypothetical protein